MMYQLIGKQEIEPPRPCRRRGTTPDPLPAEERATGAVCVSHGLVAGESAVASAPPPISSLVPLWISCCLPASILLALADLPLHLSILRGALLR